MLVKDLWLSKASNINCFNVKTLSKAKIIKKRVTDQPLDELTSKLLPIINEKSKIKYLD